MTKTECLTDYIDYVDSQVKAGLMPSTFIVWFGHETKNTGEFTKTITTEKKLKAVISTLQNLDQEELLDFFADSYRTHELKSFIQTLEMSIRKRRGE